LPPVKLLAPGENIARNFGVAILRFRGFVKLPLAEKVIVNALLSGGFLGLVRLAPGYLQLGQKFSHGIPPKG